MSQVSDQQTSYNYCALPLAHYACRPDQSRGRIYEEEPSSMRTNFQRDRDRVIHASAFRRLKYKTQVFVYHHGDHYRTRLSHTLEVAQITRSIARELMVNEDLAEAIALAHDLGHTPFAHSGEDVLAECMKHYGGFEHNDQSLRVLTHLENKYPRWRGMNLTWETLEGVVKHNGPVLDDTLPFTLSEVQQQTDLLLGTHASLEAQVAAISDDIAYNNHDVEDGLRAKMFTLDELRELALLKPVLERAEEMYPDVSEHLIVYEMVRQMIGAMVQDVIDTTRANLKKVDPSSVDDVRQAGMQIVAFSPEMEKNVNDLRAFLFDRMYYHFTVKRVRLKAVKVLNDLFSAFLNGFDMMPDNWQEKVEQAGGVNDEYKRARVVVDYIAGMTDRYALREHEKLFDLSWDVR